MTVEQIKREASALTFEDQGKVAAYLIQLRNRRDATYLPRLQQKIEDADRSHWLTPDEFEKRLDAQ